MNTSSPGKHGHAKIHFIALDLKRMKKIETIHPSTHMVQVPQSKKEELRLMALDEDEMMATLESKDGERRDNVPIPISLFGKGVKSRFWQRRTMLLLFWSKFMELSKLSASDFKLLLSFF